MAGLNTAGGSGGYIMLRVLGKDNIQINFLNARGADGFGKNGGGSGGRIYVDIQEEGQLTQDYRFSIKGGTNKEV